MQGCIKFGPLWIRSLDLLGIWEFVKLDFKNGIFSYMDWNLGYIAGWVYRFKINCWPIMKRTVRNRGMCQRHFSISTYVDNYFGNVRLISKNLNSFVFCILDCGTWDTTSNCRVYLNIPDDGVTYDQGFDLTWVLFCGLGPSHPGGRVLLLCTGTRSAAWLAVDWLHTDSGQMLLQLPQHIKPVTQLDRPQWCWARGPPLGMIWRSAALAPWLQRGGVAENAGDFCGQQVQESLILLDLVEIGDPTFELSDILTETKASRAVRRTGECWHWYKM